MHRIRLKFLKPLLHLATAFCLILVSPEIFSQQYNFRNYNVDEGLTQSEVNVISEDYLGRLWIGTKGGLCIFDGSHFKTVSKEGNLPDNLIFSIVNDQNNNIWIATMKGVAKYDGYKFSDPFPNSELTNKMVFTMALDQSGTLWMGTNSGLYFYSDKSLKPEKYEPLSSKRINDLKADENGNVHVVCMRHVYIMKNNQPEQILSDSTIEYTRLLSDSGKLWVGTDRGLYLYEGGLFREFILSQQLRDIGIADISRDKHGNIWVGTDNDGIFRVETNNRIIRFSEKNGLNIDQVVCLYNDSSGNTWIGTNGGGLDLFLGNEFIHYTKTDGLQNSQVFSLIEASDGKIWAGTLGGGLHCFDGNKIIHLDESTGLKNKYIMSLLEDDNGDVLIGTFGDGAFRLKNNICLPFPGFPTNARVLSLLKDKEKKYWFGLKGNGVISYDGIKYRKFVPGVDFPSMSVYCFLEDADGIWMGTDQGLCLFKDDKITCVGLENELIRKIVKDAEGNFWLASDASGIYYYDKENFVNHSAKTGLSSDLIFQMLMYDKETLFIGHEKGIDKITIGNKGEIKRIRHYGKHDGFSGIETNQNAILKANDGKVYFGTVNGLTILFPHVKDDFYKVTTYISGIKLFYEEADLHPFADSINKWELLPSNLSLPANKNHLTFSYGCLETKYGKNVEYQFMLEGLDQDWQPWTRHAEATYSNLSHGKYSFKVRGRDKFGKWETEPVSFSFEIQTPFYKTGWFYFIMAASGIGIVYLIIFLRTRSLKMAKQELTAQIEIHTKELRRQNVEIHEKNKSILDSIIYAKRIQDAILPPQNILKDFMADSFVLYKPKDIVSGDFYWTAEKIVVNKENGEVERYVYICVGDCTGHGVPGAFLTMLGISYLSEITSGEQILSPAQILDQLSEKVTNELSKRGKAEESKDGMDISLIRLRFDVGSLKLDRKKNGDIRIEWAGANNPLWIVSGYESKEEEHNKISNFNPEVSGQISNLKLHEVKPNKQPIGYHENRTPFTNHEIVLIHGDKVYLFSDGFADQFGGPNGKKFKNKAMKELLLSIQDKTMEEQRKMLNKTFEDWKGNLSQIDDVCIVGVRV